MFSIDYHIYISLIKHNIIKCFSNAA